MSEELFDASHPEETLPREMEALFPQEPEGPMPVKEDRDAALPEPEEISPPTRRRISTGALIFYTLYILLILVFAGGVALANGELNRWLTDYQLAQPTDKRDQIFADLFESRNWRGLYEAAEIPDTQFEGVDAFESWMNAQIGENPLELVETSAGLSGDRKYYVRMGTRSVAAFLLSSQPDPVTGQNRWELAEVEVFFRRAECVTIRLRQGQTAYANGVALEEKLVVRQEDTLAPRYLPTGVYSHRTNTLVLSGLLVQPEITVLDELGQEVPVTRDPDTGIYATAEPAFPDEISGEALAAAEAAADACGGYLSETIPLEEIRSSFDRTAPVWAFLKDLKLPERTDLTPVYAGKSISDFRQYAEDLFSLRVGLEFVWEPIPGEDEKDAPTRARRPTNNPTQTVEYTWIFQRQEDGWRCIAITEDEAPEGASRVRIRFVVDDVTVQEYFYDASETRFLVPLVSAPERMRFSGWYLRQEDPEGNGTLTLRFRPDAHGWVELEENDTLEPVTVYAVMEPETTETEDN